MMIAAHSAVPSIAWSTWTLDPLLIISLLASAIVFGRGLMRMPSATIRRDRLVRRAVYFYTALVLLGLLLMSPIDAVSHARFSVHMLQHIGMILVVAPLLALARPAAVVYLGLPSNLRRRVGAVRRHPVWRYVFLNPFLVVAASTAAVWLWHLPTLYDAALRSDVLHAIEHTSFLATAWLLWIAVVAAARAGDLHGIAIAMVFVTALQSAALGAILTFAGTPLYDHHVAASWTWGFDPMTDQQLAGVWMWIPPGTVYLVVMVRLLAAWFGALDRTSPARQGGTR